MCITKEGEGSLLEGLSSGIYSTYWRSGKTEMIWLTKIEAAEYLKVCKSTIDNLESRGLLKGHRLFLNGQKPLLRFKQEDLDNLLSKPTRGRPKVNGITHV